MSATAAARTAWIALQRILAHGRERENSISPVFIALLALLVTVFLILSSVVYVIGAPFALAGDLGIFQQEVHGLLGIENTESLTDIEIAAMTGGIGAPARREVVAAALSLTGRVSYFWGGKPGGPGWDDGWGTLQLVTAPGVAASNTYQPYGLDCGGFVRWAFWTGIDADIHMQGANTLWSIGTHIEEAELLPGDLAFLSPPDDSIINHVGIYFGKGEDGRNLYIHCTASAGGVVLNDFDGFAYFRRPTILTEGGTE